MNHSLLKPWYEDKYKLNGIEVPIQCIFMDIPLPILDRQPPHYHEYIEILYSIDTDGTIHINDRVHDFKSGDLVIINSSENHDLLFKHGNAQYIVIKVLPEILYSSNQSVFELKYTIPFLIQNATNKRHFTKEELGDRYIYDTITRMMAEWNTQDYGYELSIRSDILKIFLWVLRYWHKHNLTSIDQFEYSDETLRIIQCALEYINKNYAALTETEVAAHCNLSYSYFSRVFKKVMHQSFTSYLTSYRITKAEQYLSLTDKSVSEIAELVGFSTPSYFIQQFKAQKKISPKQYKLNYAQRLPQP